MISTQPAVPLLVHEDCMAGIKTDLAKQQENLSNIERNTKKTNDNLDDVSLQLSHIDQVAMDINDNAHSIRTSSSNTATTTSSLYSSVGTTADASTSNTVIGLLKSISNKLSL